MKIVCESCGAKYSIADEKVAGRVFKIRCKRCSEVILVRGDKPADEPQRQAVSQAPAPAAAPAAVDAPAVAAAGTWYIVVNGEQQGPYEVAALAEMLASGTIDWDAFVWRDGFENWMPLRDVEELIAQLSMGMRASAQPAAQVATAAGGYGGAVAADAFAGEPAMGADPFADEESSGAGEPERFFAAPGSGPAAAAAPRTGGGASGSPRGPAPASEMTGARNETSVLFSLRNLQALATGNGEGGSSNDAGTAGDGLANGEGSGLIDIRALAAANNRGKGEETAQQAYRDELLSLSNQGNAFGALSSPMMTPPPEEGEKSSKAVLVAAILIGFLLVAAAVVVVGVLNRQAPATAAAPVLPATKPTGPAGAASAPANPGAAAAMETPTSENEPETQTTDVGSSARDQQAAQTRQGDRRPHARRRRASGTAQPTAAANRSAEEQPAADDNGKADKASIDDLLTGALGEKGRAAARRRPTKQASEDDRLPNKPSRNDVITAMNGVKDAVAACGNGEKGVAFANVTVAGQTGRVTNATIEGQNGPVGSCIARAVRKARFPRFKARMFKVKFPFRL